VTLGSRKVYIHNIYLAPRPHSSLEVPEALAKLQDLLELEGDYITLGDFNLHHPL
jgi:endonuclease/exonuclease/phosphatase family metal-dependent hydrolase